MADPRDHTGEFTKAGLLDGLEDRERDARLALLAGLAADGVSIDEMKEALAEDRLGLLPVERVLAGEPRYTPREVAELAGVPLEFLLAMRQAIGLARPDPDEKSFDEQDLETAHAFARLREVGLPEDSLLEVSRVLGSGIAQTAEAMRNVFARILLQMDLGEDELAQRNAEAAKELLPLMTPLMDHTMRLHVRDQTRNQQIGSAELVEGAALWPAPRLGRIRGHGRLHGPGRADRRGRAGGTRDAAERFCDRGGGPAGAAGQDGRRRGDVRLARPRAARRDRSRARRARRERAGFPGAAGGLGGRRRGEPRGRLVWAAGEPRQPRHRCRSTGSAPGTREVHDATEQGFAWSYAGSGSCGDSSGVCRFTAPGASTRRAQLDGHWPRCSSRARDRDRCASGA